MSKPGLASKMKKKNLQVVKEGDDLQTPRKNLPKKMSTVGKEATDAHASKQDVFQTKDRPSSKKSLCLKRKLGSMSKHLQSAPKKFHGSLSAGLSKPSLQEGLDLQPPGSQPRRKQMESGVALVGDVNETRAEHEKRHPPSQKHWQKECPRCAYYACTSPDGDMKRTVQVYTAFGDGSKSWLAEKPPALGGLWGFGCAVCAAAGCNSAWAFRGRSHRRRTRWASYDSRRLLQGCQLVAALSSHRVSNLHQKALSLLHSPEFHLGIAQSITDTTDTKDGAKDRKHIFAGHVPQVKDYREAWAETSLTISYRKQEEVLQRKGVRNNGLRKARMKMLVVMSLVVKRKLQTIFAQATAISLAMDSRKEHKILHYKADTPEDPYHVSGFLGLYRCTPPTREIAVEDHADRAVTEMESWLKHFFTDPIDGFDGESFETFRNKVLTLSTDGDASTRKSMSIAARTLFPNTIWALRDAAHYIRIAARNPLHMDENFNIIYEELFNRSDGLVKTIQNSPKYKEIFQGIQKEVLRIPGRANAIDKVLKHFSFAKQRFDSFADPCAKLSVMLLPAASLLAFIASDSRVEAEKRARAKTMLKLFSPKFCLSLGVSADFGLLCSQFLRTFDKDDHDIAASARGLDEFECTMRAVFKEGMLFFDEKKRTQRQA